MNDALKKHTCIDRDQYAIWDNRIRVLVGENVALLSVVEDDDYNEYTAVIGIRYCPFCGEKLA